MHANQLCDLLQVNPATVRYFTRVGYLKPDIDTARRCHDYSWHDAQRLRFILCATQLGFSLDEVGSMLTEASKGAIDCPRVRALIEQRLQESRRRQAETQALRREMEACIGEWHNRHKPLTGNTLNQLIQAFASPPDTEQPHA